MTLDDVAIGEPHVDAHNLERHAINALLDVINEGRLSVDDLAATYGTNVLIAKAVSVQRILNRLAPADTPAIPPVATGNDIPTATFGSAATVTGQIIGTMSGQVTEVGTRGVWNTTFNRHTVQGYGSPAGLDFVLNGTTCEIVVQFAASGSVPIWVFVNGRPVTATPDSVTSAGSGTYHNYKMVFPTNDRRRIEFFAPNTAAWIQVGATIADVISPSPRKIVVGFVGDSFYDGSNGSAILQAEAFMLSRLLGVECSSISWGGTGYAQPGAFQTFNSTLRQGLLATLQPDLIVVSGSVNDDGFPGIQAAATLAYSKWLSAVPTAPVIVFGPQPNSATATLSANRQSNNLAVKTAAELAPNVLAYIDTIGNALSSPAAFSNAATYHQGDLVTYKGSVWMWNGFATGNDLYPGTKARWKLITHAYFGTGQVSTTASDGTRDTLLYSDGVHPTVAGALALAQRQNSLIRHHLRLASSFAL